ncbi:Trk system potassium transporter TrkA [Halotalea alkalilenta]|uniref:Trk system potassium transporter TrkA n=1 Tax=Halotalea alkalilenta TaxID=376489 RepID=UPI0004819C16|nr:Trk system potassium transporter TrkA [Halotalea alkalilenta]
MKILILGAGQVGGTLAEHLAREENDITVIDVDLASLRELHNRCEISILHGHASHPAVLAEAGCESADMLIAVTNDDEINMVACQVAYSLFKTPTKIARVRSSAYLMRRELFNPGAIPIDVLISPEQVVTTQIRRLIEYPGALQVLDFCDGMIQLVAMKAYQDGPLVGQKLRALHEAPDAINSWVSAIYRHNRPFIPDGHTVVEADDEIFFFAARRDIRTVMARMRRSDRSVRHVIIAGGGHIGERLAQSLEPSHRVKIIERDLERCQTLAERLDDTVVLHGSATSKRLLTDENIDECDIYCALTNDDEVNVMSSMLAKRLGARKVLALINNTAYVDLVQGGEIDIAISPEQATISGLLSHVRQGDLASVHSLRRGAAEAIELVVHGKERHSRVVGHTIRELGLPEGITIGVVVRGEEVLFGKGSLRIQDGDHLVLLVIDKQKLREVERLFQVDGRIR